MDPLTEPAEDRLERLKRTTTDPVELLALARAEIEAADAALVDPAEGDD